MGSPQPQHNPSRHFDDVEEKSTFRIWNTLFRYKPARRVEKICEHVKFFMSDEDLSNLPGQPLEESSPPPFPYDCDEMCIVCFHQYFPSVRQVSDEYAHAETNKLRVQMQDDRQYLQDVMTNKAEAIVGLWKKMSQKEREAFLMSEVDIFAHIDTNINNFNAFAGAPEPNTKFFRQFARDFVSTDNMGATDIDSLLESSFKKMQRYRRMQDYHHSWLLPYLNKETLTGSHVPMLALLYYRTAFSSLDWVPFDKTQIVYAEHGQVLLPLYNSHCIDFADAHFGQLTPWDRVRAHRLEIIGFTQGMIVLTAQSRMMDFLRRFVGAALRTISERHNKNPGASLGPRSNAKRKNQRQGLVPEVPPSDRHMPRWDRLIQDEFSPTEPSIPSFAYFNRPFSAPVTFDPAQALEVVTSFYHAEVDDLYQLQTNPQYIQQRVQQFSSSVTYEKTKQHVGWKGLTAELIIHVIYRKFYWEHVVNDCKKVVKYHQALMDKDDDRSRLLYDAAVDEFYQTCSIILTRHVLDIKNLLPHEPGFQWNYGYEVTKNSQGREETTLKHSEWFYQDKLFWSLYNMCEDMYRTITCDPVVSLQYFYREIESSWEQRKRVTPMLMRVISNTAVLDEIRTTILCTRGWYRYMRGSGVELPEIDAMQRGRDELRAFLDVWELQIETSHEHLQALCTEHRWPRGKLDNAWLAQARASHDALDHLWDSLQTKLLASFARLGIPESWADSVHESLGARFTEQYHREREAEEERVRVCVEREQAKKGARQQIPKPDPKLEANSRNATIAAAAAATTENQRTAVLADSKKKKKKKKTRGAAQPPAVPGGAAPEPQPQQHQQPQQQQQQQQQSGPQPQQPPAPRDAPAPAAPEQTEETKEPIAVKAEDMELLAQMYPLPGEPAGHRTFKWQQFVEVLARTGFEPRQSGSAGGSAVSFYHAESRGTIVFHQPHPEPKVDPVMLLSMGKRLAKWFGWERELFVVRGGK
ncbi:hypothetical protein F4779DRAFT_637849 [Xylariaceae sp. FL0662B]|nr:hypothetical protein F4779DRAFT_637849 [Xylariaceae sp. FL0662B]